MGSLDNLGKSVAGLLLQITVKLHTHRSRQQAAATGDRHMVIADLQQTIIGHLLQVVHGGAEVFIEIDTPFLFDLLDIKIIITHQLVDDLAT